MKRDDVEHIELLMQVLDKHRPKVTNKTEDGKPFYETTCSCGGFATTWWNVKAAWTAARDHQAGAILDALRENAACPATTRDSARCELLSAIPHDWHAARMQDGAVLSWRGGPYA